MIQVTKVTHAGLRILRRRRKPRHSAGTACRVSAAACKVLVLHRLSAHVSQLSRVPGHIWPSQDCKTVDERPGRQVTQRYEPDREAEPVT